LAKVSGEFELMLDSLKSPDAARKTRDRAMDTLRNISGPDAGDLDPTRRA
jgi:hypothetical protein